MKKEDFVVALLEAIRQQAGTKQRGGEPQGMRGKDGMEPFIVFSDEFFGNRWKPGGI